MLLIVVFCQTIEVTSNGEEALALVPSEKEEAEEPRAEHHIIGKSREVAIETRKEYTVSNEPCGTKLHPLSRIEFGTEVGGEHEWPFMAHVSVICHVKGKIRQIQTCGGTIIQKRWILTAGHCTHANMTFFETNDCDEWNQPFFEESKIRFTANQRKEMFVRVKPNEIEVIVGHKDFTKGTKAHVVNIKRHEHFRSNEFKNDLALLELNVPLEFGPDVSRICLGKKEPALIEPATIIGWGLTKGDRLKHLQKQQQQHLPNSLRQDNVRLSPAGCPNHAVCQFSRFHKTTHGDSGGPLFRTQNGRWTQIGVILGHESERSNKNFFNKISAFCEWINRATRGEVSCK
ncbi:hypothetical protein niasHT_002853 [Heterodera trifolii]|uniref:Peptidase S1 domain-containing protein n=1 Tax=Heterodera trifolii TaxID=157864 RepID=A0ABD2LR03_9BILA